MEAVSHDAHAAFRSTSKEVTTFIVAAAFASACADVFHTSGATRFKIESVGWMEWVLLVFCILLNLRYYYGNVRYIDSLPKAGGSSIRDMARVASDLLVIVGQSLLLLVGSFFLDDPRAFACVVLLTLIVEIVWYVSQTIVVSVDGEQLGESVLRERRMLIAQVIGFATTLVLVVLCLIDIKQATFNVLLTSVLVLNYAADLFVNAAFYFGATD